MLFGAVTPEARAIQAVDDAMRRRDTPRAALLAIDAVKLGVDLPQILLLATMGALEQNDPAIALSYAEKARAQRRHDPEVLEIYGIALSRNGRAREALRAYDAAIRQNPRKVSLHYNKALALDDLGENVQARRAFEHTVALEPNHAEAMGRLAYLAVLRGDNTDARHWGEETLKRNPQNETAHLAVATADVAEKNYASALARAQKLLATGARQPVNRAIAQGLVADAEHGLGHHEAAFAAYTACSDIQFRYFRPSFDKPNGSKAVAARMADYFEKADASDWRTAPVADQMSENGAATSKKNQAVAPATDPAVHAFLVGFPRSGTTLLEQVLASHPDVVTMEEQYCLAEMRDAFLIPEDGLDRLKALKSKEKKAWRKLYWKHVGEAGLKANKQVFLDKLPLNSVNLCLISTLFPDARILFALRDPVDVVFSNFRRRFGINRDMFELIGLERCAGFYDTVMRLCEAYRAKLPLEIYDTVYERLVEDFDGETRRVCDFLDLPWTEEMKNFAAVSRQNAPNTPSGQQVAQGLYRHGMRQWQAYEAQLTPVLPMLAPWRKRFGYA